MVPKVEPSFCYLLWTNTSPSLSVLWNNIRSSTLLAPTQDLSCIVESNTEKGVQLSLLKNVTGILQPSEMTALVR